MNTRCLLLTTSCLSLSLTVTPLVAQATCSSNPQTLSGAQVLKGKTLDYQTSIDTSGIISNAVFACDVKNQGWVSNSTVKSGVTLQGGVLTGYILNEGTLANIEFVGVSIKGGTLAGKIINNSRIGGGFINVHLAANAQINGGFLQGEIIGDKNAPALLENVRIKAGSKVSGVKLGKNVVSLGKNITVEVSTAITTPTTPTTSPATLPTTLKIGGLFPLIGEFSEFGAAGRNAAWLAIKQLKAAGYTVELKVVDEGITADTGVKAARQLVEKEKVQAIVGTVDSSITTAVAEQVTIPKQVLQVSYDIDSKSSSLTPLAANEGQDLLFRTMGSNVLQGARLALLAHDEGIQKLSVFYIANPYGQGLNKVFTENFKQLGGTVVAVVPLKPEVATNYQAELTNVATDGSEALVAITSSEQAEIYIPEAVKGNFFQKFLFADATKSEKLLQEVGAKTLEGLCGTASGITSSQSLDNFNASFKTEYGQLPADPTAANAYDAVVVITLAAYAAQSAGQTVTPLTIRDYLRKVASSPGEEILAGVEGLKQAMKFLKEGKDIDYHGATGDLAFDNHGNVMATAIEVWCYEAGKIVSKSVETPVQPKPVEAIGEAGMAFEVDDQTTSQETAIGNLVADIILAAAQKEDNTVVATLMNSSNLKAGIHAGAVTEENLATVLPSFGNTLVLLDVTGNQLVTALDHGLSQGEGKTPGAFPNVAGMQVTYCQAATSCSKPLNKGGVVTNLVIGGKDIDLKQTYRIATNDFLALWGGESYNVLGDACKTSGYCKNTGTQIVDLLVAEFTNHSPVKHEVDGRLQKINSP